MLARLPAKPATLKAAAEAGAAVVAVAAVTQVLIINTVMQLLNALARD